MLRALTIGGLFLFSALAPFPAAHARPGAPGYPGTPAADAQPTIAQFLKIRVPGSVDMAPDGTVYTRDWPDGIFQLYKRAPGAPANDPGKRLTDFPDGVGSYMLSPDGRWAVVQAAPGGNENNQVYLLDTQTDRITPVLQNPRVQHSARVWLRDSTGFIYTANDASPRDFYIYRYDLESKTSTLLLSRPGSWSCADVTDDGTRLLVGEYRSAYDASIYELDTRTGALTDLSAAPADGTAFNGLVGYLPGEREALIISDFDGGYRQLFVRSLAEPQATPRPLLPGFAKRDLDDAVLSHDRTLLATVHNEDGYGTLRTFRLPDIQAIDFFPATRGVYGVRGFQGDTLIYTISNAQQPGIAHAARLPARGEKTVRTETPLVTRMDSEPIDLAGFRLPELVKYTSFDGLEIPAFLYLPEGARKGTPIPFVVNFHGGPEGQFRPSFNAAIQYLVSSGYGVLQPNVRGSTGYGREFHMLDNYTKRWDSVKDGAEAARWLVREGYAEAGRIAAYGGSYGGYMAVATVIEGADVFGASVNVVGIVNMKTFLEQTSGYRQKLREAEYGPLSDPEFLLSVSPITRIDEINVPMLIAHGLNDPRVPVGEAMQLAVGLQKRGMDPEQIYFPDEGHGFAKLENRVLFSERMVKFLDRHIGAGSR